MDHHVDGFRQVARMRSSAHLGGPLLTLVEVLALSVVIGRVAILLLQGGNRLAITLGVIMILPAFGLAVVGIQQYRLVLHARGLPPDGRGLPMVEGPLRWVGRNRLYIGDQRFYLSESAGLGRQLRPLPIMSRCDPVPSGATHRRPWQGHGARTAPA